LGRTDDQIFVIIQQCLMSLAMPPPTLYPPEFSQEINQISLLSKHYAVKAYNQSRHARQYISFQKRTA